MGCVMGLINSSHNQPLWPWHFVEGTLQRWGFDDDEQAVRRETTCRKVKQTIFIPSQYGEKKHTSFFGLHLEGFFLLNTTNFFGRTKKTTNIAPPFFSGEKHVRFFKKMVLLPPQKNPMLLPGESFTFATPKSLQRSQFQTKILSEGYLPMVIFLGGFKTTRKMRNKK